MNALLIFDRIIGNDRHWLREMTGKVILTRHLYTNWGAMCGGIVSKLD